MGTREAGGRKNSASEDARVVGAASSEAEFFRTPASPVTLPGDRHTGPLQGHSASLLIERILAWTGGHPYLTQRLCQAVAQHNADPNPKSKIQNPKSKIQNRSIASARRCS